MLLDKAKADVQIRSHKSFVDINGSALPVEPSQR
jgi:hypothetical protein